MLIQMKTMLFRVGLILSKITINEDFLNDTGGTKAMSSIATVLVSLLRYLGVIVVVVGIAQFFLAMRNENPDLKTTAAMTLVAGVGLMSIEMFLRIAGIIN